MTRGRASAWWSGRSARERWLIFGMAAALGAYGVTTGVVRPILVAQDEALASIASSDRALALLAGLPEGGAPSGASGAGQPVSAIATDTATAFGMTIRRIEAEADGARLAVEDADFGDVVRWIETLEIEHGLSVVAVEMDRRPEPGVISANLTVQR